jgi:hypothetical protein
MRQKKKCYNQTSAEQAGGNFPMMEGAIFFQPYGGKQSDNDKNKSCPTIKRPFANGMFIFISKIHQPIPMSFNVLFSVENQAKKVYR